MYYFDRFDSQYYSRPIHYTSDKPTGLVKGMSSMIDREEEQVLDMIKRYQLGSLINNGFERGIDFEDVTVKRQKFIENKYLAGEEAYYFIYSNKKKELLMSTGNISQVYETKSFGDFMRKL